MRMGLRPVVEAQDRLDDISQRVRQVDRARVAPIAAVWVLEPAQLDPERVVELRDRAAEDHRPARRVGGNDGQVVLGGEFSTSAMSPASLP